jgi:hypothetical protein
MGATFTRMAAALAIVLCAFGLAYGGASWVGQPYQLSIPTHITQCGQSITGSIVLTLDHDTPCTLGVSVASSGDQILTKGSATLTTAYMLTGPTVPDGDADWVSADAFLTHVYTVQGTGSADPITLSVRGTAPGQTAPDAGQYTAAVILTAYW